MAKLTNTVLKECLDDLSYYEQMAQHAAHENQPRAQACFARAAKYLRAYLVQEGYAHLFQDVRAAA